MPQYGVQRLVLINSGNYGYAEVDLTNTVHLAAPNNRGKSTLVNALQFLYINSMRNMKFPNNDEETSRHYFGKSPSYLIFECSTPIGIKCLLIRGLSLLRGANFERYIFNGGYIQNDFVNSDGLVREFVEVQAAMADRHFKKVPNNVLWKALAGEALVGQRQVLRFTPEKRWFSQFGNHFSVTTRDRDHRMEMTALKAPFVSCLNVAKTDTYSLIALRCKQPFNLLIYRLFFGVMFQTWRCPTR